MQQMSKLEAQVECLACLWTKYCIVPPTMTKAEVEAQLEEAKAPQEEEGDSKDKSLFRGMLTTLILAGKDTEARICPIFANALRASPELSQTIKTIMQGNQ